MSESDRFARTVRGAIAACAQAPLKSTGTTRIQRMKDGEGRVFLRYASKDQLKSFMQTVSRLRCRYCGAQRDMDCRAASGKVSRKMHVTRVDDAWDIVQGRASWSEVVKRATVEASL